MWRQPRIRDIDIEINIEDLLKPLGYDDRESIQPAIMDQIVSETDECLQMMKGAMIYASAQIGRVDGDASVGGVKLEDETLLDALDGAEALAVGVCTVGAEIDKLIKECFDSGDYLRGMIADVVGSRAVENIADKCATHICTEARERKLSPTKHLSPGYGKWDVSGQRAVFSLIDPSPIDVTLNESCMMTPQKSVSFALPLREGESQLNDKPACHECGFKNCAFRRK